nr:MerR family transcriptional regulator [Bacilli bacterium]
MKIRELAEKTALSIHTIRFYEKEGLLDHRHVLREENNYRCYSDEATERLLLIKKLQRVGCSLSELKDILQEHDTHALTDLEIVEWILQKIKDTKHKKEELDQILGMLHWMLDYRVASMKDDQKELVMTKIQEAT